MELKRPLSSESLVLNESPSKKHHKFSLHSSAPTDPYSSPLFKTPPSCQAPQHSTPLPPRLPLGTPMVPVKYGISDGDGLSIIDHIDSLPTLLKTIARIVEDCGGSIEEEKKFGGLFINALNAVTVGSYLAKVN